MEIIKQEEKQHKLEIDGCKIPSSTDRAIPGKPTFSAKGAAHGLNFTAFCNLESKEALAVTLPWQRWLPRDGREIRETSKENSIENTSDDRELSFVLLSTLHKTEWAGERNAFIFSLSDHTTVAKHSHLPWLMSYECTSKSLCSANPSWEVWGNRHEDLPNYSKGDSGMIFLPRGCCFYICSVATHPSCWESLVLLDACKNKLPMCHDLVLRLFIDSRRCQ